MLSVSMWLATDWRERLKGATGLWIIGAAMATFTMLLVIALNPSFATRGLQDLLQRRAGLHLEAGEARLQFMPSLALRLGNVRLTTLDSSARQVMQAQSLTVPMSLRSLLSRKLQPEVIALEKPVFNLLIDAEGNTGWSGKGDVLDRAVAENSVPGAPLLATTEAGVLKVLDERHGVSFEVSQMALRIGFDGTGAMELTGTAAIANQFVRIDAQLASLRRLSEDGSPLDLQIKAPALDGAFAGRLALRGGLGLAGTFSATSDDAGKLSAWLGLPMPGGGAVRDFSASGPLTSSGASFTSSEVNLKFGTSEAKGALTLETGGPRPRLTGQLSTNRLALDTLLGGETGAISLDWIKRINGKIGVSAHSLSWSKVTTGPATVNFEAQDGKLVLQADPTQAFSGTLQGKLSLDATGVKPAVALAGSGESLDLGQAAQAFTGTNWFAARGGATLDVTAVGTTLEELISTLEGDASFSITDGRIAGFDLPQSLAGAAGGERSGWVASADAATGLSAVQASFRLKDGIAATEDMAATVAGAKLKAEGEIDLLRRAFDLVVAPARKITGAQLTVRVRGPWARPKISAEAAKAEAKTTKKVNGN